MSKQQKSLLNDIGKILRNLKTWINSRKPKDRAIENRIELMRCAEELNSFGVPCVKPKDEKK